MLSYLDITNFFGKSLYNADFQKFIHQNFSNLSDYDITDTDYIASEDGIELGFKNDDAVYDEDDLVVFEPGNPVFSHVNLYSKISSKVTFPFDVNFNDERSFVILKSNEPVKTPEVADSFFNKDFLIDTYKKDHLEIAFDYNLETKMLNFIQIRDGRILSFL